MAIDSNIAKNLLNELMILRLTAKNFIQYGDEKSYQKFMDLVEKNELLIAEAQEAIQNPMRVKLLEEVKILFGEYKSKFDNLGDNTREMKETLQKKVRTHQNILERFDQIYSKNSSLGSTLIASYLKYYNYTLENSSTNTTLGETKLNKFKTTLYSSNFGNQTLLKMIEDDLKRLTEGLQKYTDLGVQKASIVEKGLDTIGPKIAKNLVEISKSIEKVQDTLGPELVKTNTFSQRVVLLASSVGFFLAIISVFFVMRNLNSISSEILTLSESLQKSSEKINGISKKTASSSKKVANSSHEQAASLEETSSSLEEMDGMTRKNLESVRLANDLTNKMKSVSEQANGQMNDLVNSMKHIFESNQKIEELSGVISEIERKTRLIDEIVSQTRILSFNASVEAERAGEHGKGFAVVAEEVGNLAKTSGEAAKEIQDIVANSLKTVDKVINLNREKVEAGNNITKETKKILESINTNCDDVLVKNEEVLNATNEQALGIKQINVAVSELDRTTQENSTIAQETTFVATDLDQQAELLYKVVSDLNMLLGVGSSGSQNQVEDKLQSGTESEKVNPMRGQESLKGENILNFGKQETVSVVESEAVGNDASEKVENKTIASNDPWDAL